MGVLLSGYAVTIAAASPHNDPDAADRPPACARGPHGLAPVDPCPRLTGQWPPACPMPRATTPGTSMRTFVLRARAAPTDSQALLASVGKDAHTEILAHTLMNAFFVAQSHRPMWWPTWCWKARGLSRAHRVRLQRHARIGGFDERALLGKVAKALDVSKGMGRTSRARGIGRHRAPSSFERLVQALAEDTSFPARPRAADPRAVFAGNPVSC